MKTRRNLVKPICRIGILLLAGIGNLAVASEYTNASGGDWEVPNNWDTATVPSGTDQIIIAGSAGGQEVTMDTDSWQYIQNNGLEHSSTEYRTQKLLLAESDTATLNVDIGNNNVWKATEGGTYFVGSASGSVGTLNVLSGSCILEGAIMKIAESAGSTGLIHVTGANSYFAAARASGVTSLLIGDGGAGTFHIDGGTLETRMGVTIGGSGVFHVEGSSVTSIGIGSRSSLDGNWFQQSGGIFKVGIDAGGITPVFIDDFNDDGGGDVSFESGALLEIGFLDGYLENGSWDIMQWEGTLTDNGLTFAPGMNADFWSFSYIDTDSTNGVDTLRVSYFSESTTNNTPYSWLNEYYPGLSSAAEYQEVDDSDSDKDGMLTWAEYIACTNPTNGASVLAMTIPNIKDDTIILKWSSVAGKRYGVTSSDDLVDTDWETIASGIIGLPIETAITSTVSSALNLSYQAYIESMPNRLELGAEADAYVQSGSFADTNYGSLTELKTLNTSSDEMETLLRFDLPSTTENPDSAFIWINVTALGTDPIENMACLIDDNSWGENTVTWNNKPAAGEELDAWVTTNGTAIKIDVTKQISEALNGGGLFSVMIKSPHDIGADGQSIYGSRENAAVVKPKLVLNFNVPKVEVQLGTSIQTAIDSIHAQGGGHVILAAGNHLITESLEIYSDITLCGQGAALTSILMDPLSNEPILIGTSEGSVNSDITITQLTLDGQQHPDEQHYPGDTDRNTIRGDCFGILFTDQDSGNTFERIRFENVLITRCAMGIHVKGVDDLRILNSEIRGNGCLIGYDHNIYFRRAKNTLLKNLNISDCTAGNGFNLSTACFNLIIDNCDASDNNFRGIRFEAGDGGGRMMIINCITSRNGLTEDQPGIRVASVPDFTILGCTANGNGNDGFYCVNSSNGLLKNNSAGGNGDQNYQMQNCSYVQMNNVGW